MMSDSRRSLHWPHQLQDLDQPDPLLLLPELSQLQPETQSHLLNLETQSAPFWISEE
jgi:hypothetical protein